MSMCQVCHKTTFDDDLCPSCKPPEMGPLIFDGCGSFTWLSVYANDRGEKGDRYGDVWHDGSRWEADNDAGPMSFKEIQALYWWMESRQQRGKK